MRQQPNSRWIASGVLGLLGLVLGDTSSALAGTIPRIGGGGSISISLYQLIADGTYRDVSDTYLPRVDEVVYVVVNGGGTPTLVPPTGTSPAVTHPPPGTPPTVAQLNPYLNAQTTSAYLGVATNFPSPRSDQSPNTSTPDFDTPTSMTLPIAGSPTGYGFIARDYGGMLVVMVGSDKFVIPKDINPFNGIPDSWETSYSLASLSAPCPNAEADCDPGPGGNGTAGDGISNFDEYRGFIVSGQHVRTDPRVKNLFAHLVTNQCTGGSSQLGGAGLVPLDSLFSNANTLITGTTLSVLGVSAGASVNNTNEWVNDFQSYSEETKTITYVGGIVNAPVFDRRVNLNAVYPVRDVITGLYVQKGLRVTECVDSIMPADLATTVMGSAGLGSANGPDNALIYTDRIIRWVNAKCTGSCNSSPRISTYTGGAWATAATTNISTIHTKMIQYIVAMEIGHSVKLTPTVEGSRKTSYGYHHAPGTGTNMDVQANFSSPTFSIPSLFSTPDQSSFKVHN